MFSEIIKLEPEAMYIVYLVGLVCWGFILWVESKKDGFGSDRFFDLVFSSVLLAGVSVYFLNRLVEWLKIYHPNNYVLFFDHEVLLGMTAFSVSFVPIFYFSKRFKWSTFRIVDIYSKAFCLLLVFLGFGKFLVSNQGEYLILSVLLSVLYFAVMRHRGYKFMSGTIFSILLFFLSVSFFTYFRKNGYLLFGLFLVTIGILNLYLRGKKTMAKTIFPEGFISNLRKKLLSKEKRLVQEQQTLIKDDPYLQQGRATDNAETMDDVLEDTGKTITDARLNVVSGMKVQVRKALAAMKLGKYGKCEVCGNAIDKARLEVYPEATTCINCATDQSQIDEIREDEVLEKSL